MLPLKELTDLAIPDLVSAAEDGHVECLSCSCSRPVAATANLALFYMEIEIAGIWPQLLMYARKKTRSLHVE